MMNSTINEKKIKELCGITAFKKGKAYFLADKVHLHPSPKDEKVMKATVKAGENFIVTIKADSVGEIVATCTCPPVGFVSTYCQHIAAALISLDEKQRMDGYLAERMLNLFEKKTSPPTGKQLHFDERKILEMEFTCCTVPLEGLTDSVYS